MIGAFQTAILGLSRATGGDPYFNNVVFLPNFIGTDNSTTITDIKGHPVTVAGNAKILSNQLYLDGNGDYLSCPDSDDWSFGSGDYTIEAIITPTNFAAQRAIVGQWAASLGSWILFIDQTTGRLGFATANTSGNIRAAYTTATLTAGVQVHVAVSKVGSTLYMYVNGTRETPDPSTYHTDLYLSSRNLYTGQNGASASYFLGYMKGVRVTEVVGRYSSATITPPTEFPTS